MTATTGDVNGEKQRLFAFVRETTDRAKALGLAERAKAARGVSASTAGTYARLAKARLDVSSETGGVLMSEVTARSWNTTRAALLHESTLALVQARKACDVAQKAGDMAGAWIEANKARRALEAFETVQAAQKPDTTTPKRTARKTLPTSPDWMRQAFDAATPAQRAAVAVLWASGCRPAEIEKGVDVEKRAGAIVLEIPGAKVKADAGQPKRTIAIALDSAAGKALLEVLGNEEKTTITRPAHRIGKDFADIRAKSGLGKITAYSFRHQFAAEVKAKYGSHTVGAEQIAAAMGHRVTRSQKHYGSKAQAKGGSGILVVKAALPVKETRNRPATPRKERAPKPSGPLGFAMGSDPAP